MLNSKIVRNQLMSRRTFILGIGKIGLFSVLLGRMFYMQLLKESEYKKLSDKNRIHLVMISPIRGRIYDRHKLIIADNQQCFKLFLDKKSNSSYNEELKIIGQILDLPDNQIQYVQKKVKNASKKMPILIVDQLTWEQISCIEEFSDKLHSIFIDVGTMRYYPFSTSLSHLIGYIGQINEAEVKKLSVSNPDFVTGKSGIEKFYENKLRGNFGYKQMEVNAFAKYVKELEKVEPSPGEDLDLHIDASLQAGIMPYLNPLGCSALVSNCNNGEMLIFAVTPTFELNNFTRLSKKYWTSLVNDPYKPLINKVIQNAYPPGSVFKIITILAALEAGITPDTKFKCTHQPFLANSFRCASKIGHGLLNMTEALKYSCNHYIYNIARIIGAQRIINTAKKFGFGDITHIDLPGEKAGFLPSLSWKKEKLKSEWSLGDTLNLSIGQGFLLATPMQLLYFCAGLANGSRLYKPRIADTNVEFKELDIPDEHLKIIKEGMHLAVNEIGGTGFRGRINGRYQLAGKTGTSQVRAKSHSREDLSSTSLAWTSRNHAIFVGFGPFEDPKYAITVFVDHGGSGGSVAAPIAGKIMQEVMNKMS